MFWWDEGAPAATGPSDPYGMLGFFGMCIALLLLPMLVMV